MFMDNKNIKQTVDKAFQSAFSTWEKQIEKDLYPDAFANPSSWLRVKSAMAKNNDILKAAIIQALDELLSTN